MSYPTYSDLELEIQNLEEENKRVKERADDKQAELRKEIKHLNEMIYKFEEENRKLKLHIEAKDKAYTALLKDYEDLKKDKKNILDEIEAELERFKAFRNRH